MRKMIAAAGVFVLSVGLMGCSTVQPWQKGNLAKPEMAFDPDPLQTRFAEHTYFSKEGASGGMSVGGGGCGCN
ncbi:MAG: DUF4266 domain-containing protein [Burkholderiaceae bacterium]|nr:DUF4266 domain-containing protein [Burkholderiaceae bacterium]